jgi:hypothetical protein
MKRLIHLCLCVVGVVGVGCGADFQDEAQNQIDELDATKDGHVIVSALQSIGLLPKYDCGQPEKEQLLSIIPAFEQKLGHCASVTRGPGGDTFDEVDVQFPADGCKVGSATWTGSLAVTYSGGDDHTEVALDLHQLSIDGHPVDGRIGQSTCGDLSTYEVDLHTKIPTKDPSQPVEIVFDGNVTDRPGLPVVGTDFYVIDGKAGVTEQGKDSSLVFSQLFWEPGANLPHSGSLTLNKPNGHTLEFTFDEDDHKASVSVDGQKAVPLPQP